jgi:hypothetical protein
MNNVKTPSELETELDFSVENVSSTHQLSEESVRYPEEWYGILGPTPPCVLKIGKIKGKISDTSLVEDHKDDKVSNDNVKYTILMKRYSKHFKEKPSSKSFHLAPMQLHQNGFKEDYLKWSITRNRGSHENIRKHDKVYQSSNNSYQPIARHKVKHASERIHLEAIFQHDHLVS